MTTTTTFKLSDYIKHLQNLLKTYGDFEKCDGAIISTIYGDFEKCNGGIISTIRAGVDGVDGVESIRLKEQNFFKGKQ